MDNPYQPPSVPSYGPDGGYPYRPDSKRPAAVTVLGILNVIFGALGLICTPISGAFLFVTLPANDANPALALFQDPTYRAVMMAMLALGMVAAAVELASGLGLLKLKRWGRTLALGYAAYTIVAVIAGTAFNYIYVFPKMRVAGGNANPQAAAGMMGGMIGGTIGTVVGLIYPVVLIVLLCLPSVAEAFRARETGPEDLPKLNPLGPEL